MSEPGPSDDERTYDIADAAPSSPPPKPVLHYAEPNPQYVRNGFVAPKAEPEAIKNLFMPLWLLAGGVVIEFAAAALRAQSIDHIAIDLLLGTVLMLVGIQIAARIRGIDLGTWRDRLLKLLAISIAPTAALTLCTPFLDHIPFGWLIGLIGQFVFYFALLGALFDLDESDTWYCVWVIFLVHLAVYFLAMWGTR